VVEYDADVEYDAAVEQGTAVEYDAVRVGTRSPTEASAVPYS